MNLKLDIGIKKLSTSDVILTLKGYVTSLGFTGNLKNPPWYMGYACALRDAGIIDHDTWNDLTDRINDNRLLKIMQRYAEKSKREGA